MVVAMSRKWHDAAPSPLRGGLGRGTVSKELRRKLRREPSAVERRFWRLIHPLRVNGWHFRKQVELGPYYVDFACLHAGLVIEIDGVSHDSPAARLNDETRDDYLTGRGFYVLRISNADVLQRPEGVYTLVVSTLERRAGNHRAAPPPQPSPQGGGCLAGDRGEGKVR